MCEVSYNYFIHSYFICKNNYRVYFEYFPLKERFGNYSKVVELLIQHLWLGSWSIWCYLTFWTTYLMFRPKSANRYLCKKIGHKCLFWVPVLLVSRDRFTGILCVCAQGRWDYTEKNQKGKIVHCVLSD